MRESRDFYFVITALKGPPPCGVRRHLVEGGASIGQVWTRHLAPAAPASRPSSPSQFHDCPCHADSALQFVPSLVPGWGKSRAASTVEGGGGGGLVADGPLGVRRIRWLWRCSLLVVPLCIALCPVEARLATVCGVVIVPGAWLRAFLPIWCTPHPQVVLSFERHRRTVLV